MEHKSDEEDNSFSKEFVSIGHLNCKLTVPQNMMTSLKFYTHV